MSEAERFLEARAEWTQRSYAQQAAFADYLPLPTFQHLREQGWLIEARPYGPKIRSVQLWALWLVRDGA